MCWKAGRSIIWQSYFIFPSLCSFFLNIRTNAAELLGFSGRTALLSIEWRGCFTINHHYLFFHCSKIVHILMALFCIYMSLFPFFNVLIYSPPFVILWSFFEPNSFFFVPFQAFYRTAANQRFSAMLKWHQMEKEKKRTWMLRAVRCSLGSSALLSHSANLFLFHLLLICSIWMTLILHFPFPVLF